MQLCACPGPVPGRSEWLGESHCCQAHSGGSVCCWAVTLLPLLLSDLWAPSSILILSWWHFFFDWEDWSNQKRTCAASHTTSYPPAPGPTASVFAPDARRRWEVYPAEGIPLTSSRTLLQGVLPRSIAFASFSLIIPISLQASCCSF